MKIRELWHERYSGKDMLEILNRFHGYNLTEDELKRIQLSLGLHLCNVKAEHQEEARATANTII